MNLYMVHCGYYDLKVSDGLFESHVNYFIVANSFDDARIEIKKNPEFIALKMHIDGLQEISTVQGFRILCHPDESLKGQTIVRSHKHRDLAPKPSTKREE